ncbi:DUF1349 domain-containing protein [Streptomyces tubbatahanensis]|uniref:DUF1349 domain-containing protein n=1 Tax=Streptomyces tubbatahanensis TaxID=2923272 RepID=A0ABY3Y0P2_9ACTN|nr:DUF1349 domain-containing protein [Streptomyces tubbatahanensis]UNT00313.1 DUF1349 domain-containing protein [Streptomyces tubbatahanensis]
MTAAQGHPRAEPAAPLPGTWYRLGPPAESVRPAPGGLRLTAGAGTDLYAMPAVREIDALPALVRRFDGDFRLCAGVVVEDGTRFADAGGLVVRTGAGSVKLCVERTAAGSWAVVTVASLPYSDEAMGPALPGPRADLLVTRQGRRFAGLFRTPGDADWRFARTLCLPEEPLWAGVCAQAPFSAGSTTRFHDLTCGPEPLRDRR